MRKLILILSCSMLLFSSCKTITYLYVPKSELTNEIEYSSWVNLGVEKTDTTVLNNIIEYAKYLCVPSYKHDYGDNGQYVLDLMNYSAYYSSTLKNGEDIHFVTIVIKPPDKIVFEINNLTKHEECRFILVYSFENKKYYKIDGFEFSEIDQLKEYMESDVNLHTVLSYGYSNSDWDLIYNETVDLIFRKTKQFKKNHCVCNKERKFDDFLIW